MQGEAGCGAASLVSRSDRRERPTEAPCLRKSRGGLRSRLAERNQFAARLRTCGAPQRSAGRPSCPLGCGEDRRYAQSTADIPPGTM